MAEIQAQQVIRILSDNRLGTDKTAILAGYTPWDRACVGGEWFDPSLLKAGTQVDGIYHSRRHDLKVGGMVSLCGGNRVLPVQVKIERIIWSTVKRLSDDDFRRLGFADRTSAEVVVGNGFGGRVWFIEIIRL
jgi:hypothetical protein